MPSAPGCPTTVTLTPGCRSALLPATVLLTVVSPLSWILVSWPVLGLWMVIRLPLTEVTWPAVPRPPKPPAKPPLPPFAALPPVAAEGEGVAKLRAAVGEPFEPAFDCEYFQPE